MILIEISINIKKKTGIYVTVVTKTSSSLLILYGKVKFTIINNYRVCQQNKKII